MFADSDFYTNEYHGKLSGFELEKSLRRANAYIGALILYIPDDIPETVKYAVCEIADIYAADEQNGEIVSENNDGYSVTYNKSRATENKACDIAMLYLTNTGLLNRKIH